MENDTLKEHSHLSTHVIDRLEQLYLWLASGCNSKCVMCDIWKQNIGSQITVDAIRQWIIDWKTLHVQLVVLCGEPLLHRDVWLIAQAIRDAGIRVEMLSNGFLVQKHATKIVRYCDAWAASLDGPEAIHNQIRGVPNAYRMLRRGISAVRDIDDNYRITGRCAIHKLNFRYLVDTVHAARELGLTSLSFSATDLSNEEAFQRHNRINTRYQQTLNIAGNEIEEASDRLNELYIVCADEFASGFITDSPDDLDRTVLQYYRALAGQCSFPNRPCNVPWKSAVVEYDGTVRPCFPMEQLGKTSTQAPLYEILNQPDSIQMRQKLNTQNNTICQHCVCQSTL